MDNKRSNKKQQYLQSQSMLIIKAFLGGYLLYLAYDVISTEVLMETRMGIVLLCILFVVAGIVLVVMSVRSLIRGEYIGGKEDLTEEGYEEKDHQSFGDDDANNISSERMQ